MSYLYLKRLQSKNDETSGSDSEDEVYLKKRKIPVAEDIPEGPSAAGTDDDLFFIDTEGHEANAESVTTSGATLTEKSLEPYKMDKDLQELLGKAITGDKYEQNHQPQVRLMSKRAQGRKRKEEREKTKGKAWFGLPATELDDKNKADLELLQMRGAVDPLAHYRNNDRTVLPKYFQVGTVVDAPEDYYSSRIFKKDRRKTLVDELLHNEEAVSKAKKRYTEVQAAQAKKKKGAFQRTGYAKSHKKQAEGKKKRK